MPEISGIKGKVQIGKFPYTFPISFISGDDVIGIQTWLIDYTTNILDVTDFVDNGISKYITGKTNWLAAFDGLKDGEPISIGTEVTLFLYESDINGIVYYGQAVIENQGIFTAADKQVLYTYGAQGLGDLMSYTN